MLSANGATACAAYFDALAGIGPPVSAGTLLGGACGSVAEPDAAAGYRRSRGGGGHVFATARPHAERVIAVDNSENMVEFGAKLARKHGVKIWNTGWEIWNPFPLLTQKWISRFSVNRSTMRCTPSARLPKPGVFSDRVAALPFWIYCVISLRRRASFMPTCGWASPNMSCRAS